MPNVKIRIEKGVETAGDGREQQEKNTQTEKMAVASMFAHQVINTGKQALNYALSNYGNITGDYAAQSQINTTLDIIGDITTIGTGFAAGGWVGGAIALISVATKNTFKVISGFQEMEKSNRQQNYLRDRTGNATLNESRGTQN